MIEKTSNRAWSRWTKRAEYIKKGNVEGSTNHEQEPNQLDARFDWSNPQNNNKRFLLLNLMTRGWNGKEVRMFSLPRDKWQTFQWMNHPWNGSCPPPSDTRFGNKQNSPTNKDIRPTPSGVVSRLCLDTERSFSKNYIHGSIISIFFITIWVIAELLRQIKLLNHRIIKSSSRGNNEEHH